MHAISSIAGVFALILMLARLKTPLAVAIFAGALLTGLLFDAAPSDIARWMLRGVMHPRTLGLVAITLLQLVLSYGMESSGQLREMVTLMRRVLRRPAVAAAALPALIGLLPMPGGALFSAPMVASAADTAEIAPDRLSAINYWFRHIWEHWWPIYPGVLLAMTLTGRSFGDFALTQLPLGIIMATCGLLVFRGTHPALHAVQPPPPPGTARALIRSTASIWLIVVVAVPVGLLARTMFSGTLSADTSELVLTFGPVGLGLLAGLIWTAYRGRQSALRVFAHITRGSVWSMLLLVTSVMVFQYILGEVKAASAIAEELRQLNVPLIVVVAALPFVAGAVTGLAVGFVGTSFPIVLPLMIVLAGDGSTRAFVALAYAFGHIGQMVSPLHLCYIVSNRYFSTPFAPVYRIIMPAITCVGFLTILYVIVLRLLGL